MHLHKGRSECGIAVQDSTAPTTFPFHCGLTIRRRKPLPPCCGQGMLVLNAADEDCQIVQSLQPMKAIPPGREARQATVIIIYLERSKHDMPPYNLDTIEELFCREDMKEEVLS